MALILLVGLLLVTAWWFWPKQPTQAQQGLANDQESTTIDATSPQAPSAVNSTQVQTDENNASAPLSLDQVTQVIEQQGHISITGRPIDEASLRANQQRLLDELKGQKRPINPSTMSPLMALEYEQFGRYLERGDFMRADQLLTDMQESWPDYDYEDMIYQLAMAEVQAGH